MGTGAFMTLNNHTGHKLHCRVLEAYCMFGKENDGNKEGSKLYKFNVDLADNTSLSGIYIEAIGSDSCGFEQSHFTLSFSGEVFDSKDKESLKINLGSGLNGTGIVFNTHPAVIKVTITKGDQYRISIDAKKMSLPVSLANSLLRSNRRALQKKLRFPPVEDKEFKISPATLGGIDTLVCAEASVSPTSHERASLSGKFETKALHVYCELEIKSINFKLLGMFTILQPKLSLEGRAGVMDTDTGSTILIQATKISLEADRVVIPGYPSIPSGILNSLLLLIIGLLDTPGIQKSVLDLINKLIQEKT